MSPENSILSVNHCLVIDWARDEVSLKNIVIVEHEVVPANASEERLEAETEDEDDGFVVCVPKFDEIGAPINLHTLSLQRIELLMQKVQIIFCTFCF